MGGARRRADRSGRNLVVAQDDAPPSIATRLTHAAPYRAPRVRTVPPVIQLGSTVLHDTVRDLTRHDVPTYGRSGLATHEALKAALCELEGARACELYPSGVAAISGALSALLKSGDTVLVADSAYAPTRRFFDDYMARYGVRAIYYPPRTDPDALFAMGGADLRLIFLESPGSLTFEMQDVPAIASRARAHGVLTVIDNTWAAGLLFRPLDHGVDVSIQSLTKYVCGHSDVFLGSACARTPALARALSDGVRHMGWAVSPGDAYQALRGLRTLALRLERHGASGLEVAAWLAAQPEVAEVLHPGLPASPDHDLFRRDFSGACGLFGLRLVPGDDAAVAAMLDGLDYFGLGFSWGGFESLATHCDADVARRRHSQPAPGPFVRLHIGLESTGDLIADLRRGLDRYSEARREPL